ncbi:MAG: hypothetical protein MI861_04590 [Pirellulales bacterium]|nr:hypothetical protein [Pirellulales bacterium]
MQPAAGPVAAADWLPSTLGDWENELANLFAGHLMMTQGQRGLVILVSQLLRIALPR